MFGYCSKISIPNTGDMDEVCEIISDLKKSIRREHPNATFKVRGRGNRVEAFKKTGRYHHTNHADGNDVYLSQPEAQYMSHFMVYVYNMN